MKKAKKAPENSGGTGASVPPIGRRFEPGQSGNPGGRPKEFHEFRKLLQEDAAEAHRVLVDLVKEGNVEALKVFLAYAFGKPAKEVQISGAGGGPLKVGVYDFSKLSDEKVKILEEVLGEVVVRNESSDA